MEKSVRALDGISKPPLCVGVRTETRVEMVSERTLKAGLKRWKGSEGRAK